MNHRVLVSGLKLFKPESYECVLSVAKDYLKNT